MKCRGQISLTLILALVIIAVFVFAFYATGSLVLKKVDVSQQKQQAGSEAVKPITDYVTQCLDQTARSGLDLLGKQGGRIYRSQGGTFPEPGAGTEYHNQSGDIIPYGIIEDETASLGNIFRPGTFTEYPYPTYPRDLFGGPDRFDGFYGLSTLPSLEGQKSTHEALTAFIETALPRCLDWGIFSNRGVNVNPGQVKVNISFAAEDTRVVLDYPINISIPTSGVTAYPNTFAVSYPVRLHHLYNFSHAVITYDVTDISFDLGVQQREVSGVNMSVSISHGTEADVVYIQDPGSVVFNQDFVFRFARENRQPALRYIGDLENTIDVCSGSNVSFVEDHFNVTTCDQVITRSLIADDPDEDELLFEVSRLADGFGPEFTLVKGPAGSNRPFDFAKLNVTVWDGQKMDGETITPKGFQS